MLSTAESPVQQGYQETGEEAEEGYEDQDTEHMS